MKTHSPCEVPFSHFLILSLPFVFLWTSRTAFSLVFFDFCLSLQGECEVRRVAYVFWVKEDGFCFGFEVGSDWILIFVWIWAEMERDFMGLNSRESLVAVKEETNNDGCRDTDTGIFPSHMILVLSSFSAHLFKCFCKFWLLCSKKLWVTFL